MAGDYRLQSSDICATAPVVPAAEIAFYVECAVRSQALSTKLRIPQSDAYPQRAQSLHEQKADQSGLWRVERSAMHFKNVIGDKAVILHKSDNLVKKRGTLINFDQRNL